MSLYIFIDLLHYKFQFVAYFRLSLIKDYCLSFIVKEDNFYDIIMSSVFVNLDKPLMVEIIRKRLNPGRNTDIRFDKTIGRVIQMMCECS